MIQIGSDDREIHRRLLISDRGSGRRFALHLAPKFLFSARVPRIARTCGFVSAFLILCILTWILWQWRFVPVASSSALTLDHIPPGVTLTKEGPIKTEGGIAVLGAGSGASKFDWQWLAPPVSRYAHIAIKASCHGIEKGKMSWDDARIALVWVDSTGKIVPEQLALWSGHGDRPQKFSDMIAPISRNGALPKIIVTNRGTAGTFTIESFQVQQVELRPGFRFQLAGILAAWLYFVWQIFRRSVAPAGSAWPRPLFAAMLWIGFAWLSSLPGPWVPWRPILRAFPVSAVPPPAAKKLPPPAPPDTSAIPPKKAPADGPPVARTSPPRPAVTGGTTPAPLEGGLVRWYFNKIPSLKRPMHLCVFAGIGFSLALLLGSVRAASPALALSALSEICQWLFGFGFDLGDVADLALDAVAVFAGVLLWRGLLSKLEGKREGRGAPAVAPCGG